MNKQEIENYNCLCAEFLGVEYEIHSSTWRYKDLITTELQFHSDWNWIMKVINEILIRGFRKYTYTNEDHSRCVFTDMSILYQNHEFGGGNIVADSKKCNSEKEAVVQAINQFLIWYNNE